MTETITTRIHTSLVDAFRVIGKEFADRIKKEYNLRELFVSDVFASQLIAGRVLNRNNFNFKVRKTSLTTGVLEFD